MFSRAVPAIAIVLATITVSAQQPQSPPAMPPSAANEEVRAVMQGWALLAQGLVREASARATQILTTYPRSSAALALAVEAEVARGGASAGLDQYERWLGQRTLEEPLVLRRLAIATLRDESKRPDSSARVEALGALAGENDAGVTAELESAAAKGGSAETRLLARMGQERAVGRLVAELKAGAGTVPGIEALGQSGSKSAAAALVDRFADPRPEFRGAAAEAVGRLGARDQIERLKTLLTDQSSYVRIRAAAALFRLEDDTGLPLLQELIASEPSAGRLIAAEAMATRPDAAWLALVRRLAEAPEPEVRLGAARLIAPHDPALANAVIQSLWNDANVAVRELASQTAAESSADLKALRTLMRHQDAPTRVAAAHQVVTLTR